MEALFIQDESALDYTPGGASIAGEVAQLADGRVGIVTVDLAASELGSLRTRGVFDLLAATGTTFLIGEAVYWDASANLAINLANVGVGDFFVGFATKAKVSGPLVVRVDINPVNKPRQQKTVSSAVTLAVSDLDSTIFGNTQGGAFSITLPAAAACTGRRLTIIRTGSGTNALTVDGDGTELIDAAQTHATMDAIYDTITIEAGASAWFVVAQKIA